MQSPPTFSMGRRRQPTREERTRARRYRVKPAKPSKTPAIPGTRLPAFPLSIQKLYDFTTNFTLAGFPHSSVKAVQYLQKLIAPPENPSVFDLKPDQIKKIVDAFYENIQARWQFKRIVLAWLSRRCKVTNEDDPITLEKINQPIEIYSLPTKSISRYEAKSLAGVWKTNLLAHDGIFPDPKIPTNPLTNLSFNLLQIHSAIKKIRQYGQTNWILDSYSSCNYDLCKWQKKFAGPLRIETIQQVFSDRHSFDRYDMLMDFAELQHEYHDVSFNKTMFSWIFRAREVAEYGDCWVRACKKFYIEKYSLLEKEDLEDLEIRTSIQNAYLIEIPTIVKVLYNKYLEARDRNVTSRRRVQNRIIAR